MKQVESNIPTTMTADPEKYNEYVTYMLDHFHRLSGFYGFSTTEDRWLNRLGTQKAAAAAVNILLNGGPKYNKREEEKIRPERTRRRGRSIESTETDFVLLPVHQTHLTLLFPIHPNNRPQALI